MTDDRRKLRRRVAADRFGEKLGDVPAGVVDDLTLLDGLPSIQAIALHQRAARRVHLDFERNAEFAAVTEHGHVLRRKACGAGVEVVGLVEGAGLRRAVGHFDASAVANRPVSSAGAAACLENRAAVARLGKLPSGYQPRDSGAENHNALALAGIGGKT